MAFFFFQENIPEQVKICPEKNVGAFCDYNSINDSETKKQTVLMTWLFIDKTVHL